MWSRLPTHWPPTSTSFRQECLTATVALTAAVFLALTSPVSADESALDEVRPQRPALPSYLSLSAGETFEPAEHGIGLVRRLYQTMEDYAADSGNPIELDLSDFKVIQREDFLRHRWVDVLDLPNGYAISLTRSSHRDHGLDQDTLVYEPEWVPFRVSWESLSEGSNKPIPRRSIQENLQFFQQERPGYRDINYLITYQVTATLDGKTIQYRAATLFRPLTPQGELRFFAEDNVTQGIERVLRERTQPGAGPIGNLEALLPPEPNTTCKLLNDQDSDTKSGNDTAGHHLGGNHKHSLSFDGYCDCNTSCRSKCNVVKKNQVCDDSGWTPGYCHSMAKATDSSSTTKFGAIQEGAKCAGAGQCAMTICSGGCGCISQASVTVAGTGISFGTSPSATWTSNFSYNVECAACPIQISPPAPPGPPVEPPPGVGSEPDPRGSTPIVIDLAGHGFQFTSVEEGVFFDLNADGAAEQTAWTSSSSNDGFLVLDRNENGTIDDGRELFGGVTEQPRADFPNGYLALAVFDTPEEGGYPDGWIGPEDAIFPRLRVWVDRGHDGVSDSGELFGLAELGISKIHFRFRESLRQDRHGNQLRFLSEVELAQQNSTRSVDVIFRVRL